MESIYGSKNFLQVETMRVDETTHSARIHDTVSIPVEDLGVGLFNILGDMIGGLIGLQLFAFAKAREGLATIKEKMGNSETSGGDDSEPLPIDPALRPAAVHPRQPTEILVHEPDEKMPESHVVVGQPV